VSPPSSAAIQALNSITEFSPMPAAWLCDIWGVLHNGAEAFPEAVAACRTYRQTGGIVLLVSNAPRPATAVGEQFIRLGIPADAYDGILTSGDVTRGLLATVADKKLLHIGPERDLGLFAGLDLTLVEARQAEVIICTGLFDDTRETAEDYRARFIDWVGRGLPMVCANPDIFVDRGGEIIACAGALAALYGELGGTVRYAGKPYPEVYATALAWLANRAQSHITSDNVLVIGDGVHTDIKGAAQQGIRSVYVASSIYLKEPFSASSVTNLFADLGYSPTAAMPTLR
jgi:HAD superfamily hydrolase (TIGR01459 family)